MTTSAAPSAASSGADYEPLEAGYYLATLTEVAEIDKDPDLYNAEKYKEFRFRWQLALPDGTEREYTTWAKAISAHNERAWLTRLMVALGVCDGTNTLDWPPENWVGKKVRINLEEQLRTDGTSKNRTAGYAPAARPKAAVAAAKPRTPAPKPAPVVEELLDDELPF